MTSGLRPWPVRSTCAVDRSIASRLGRLLARDDAREQSELSLGRGVHGPRRVSALGERYADGRREMPADDGALSRIVISGPSSTRRDVGPRAARE
jgi:hypothetical protein